jgi:hypothetical protein
MTILSTIDRVYTTGIQEERIRVRADLEQHLRKTHAFGDADIAETFRVLGLNYNAVLIEYRDPQCSVCGSRYNADKEETKSVHGVSLHDACIAQAEELAVQLFGKAE